MIRIRNALRNSPWIAIAVAVHVILVAVLAVVYLFHGGAEAPTRGMAITVAERKLELQESSPPTPKPVDRMEVPKNVEAELVTEHEETFIPFDDVEQSEDLYTERGDPSGLESANPGLPGGTSIGVGPDGRYGRGEPSISVSRQLGSGLPPGTPGGPTIETARAVLEGLRWLLRHQNEGGSWGGATYYLHCSPPNACLSEDAGDTVPFYDEGLTALALLCFLGQGAAHNSKLEIVDRAMGKSYKPVGDFVKKGLKWLGDRQREDGRFSEQGFMYNEALATMAMCEAYALTRARPWKQSAENGLAYLLAAQKPSPDGNGLWGWRYGARGPAERRLEEARANLARAQGELETVRAELERLDAEKAAGAIAEDVHLEQTARLRESLAGLNRDIYAARSSIDESRAELHDADISVTTWVVMAIKSAELAGLDVPQEAIDGALEFARHVTGDGGLVGYQNASQAGFKIRGARDHYVYHVGTMSALNMLVRTFLEKDIDDPFLEQGAEQLVRDLPEVSKDHLSIDYYYWYKATLALNQFDGPGSPRESGRYWKLWNDAMGEALLDLQDKTSSHDVCTRGGWLVDDRWSGHGHALYNTAINVLTLEVYYRFENAFGAVQRGGG